MRADRAEGDDFLSFYRWYARTGTHAAAAALLTLFGLLASVAGHWAFVGVGVAIYVLPPAYLYVTRGRADTGANDRSGDASTERDAERSDEAAAGDVEPRTSKAESHTNETGSRTRDAAGEPWENTPDEPVGWRWHPTTPPTEADLADATTAADGVYVAGTGGALLARRNGDWETVLESGAGGDGNDFTAVDATDDGRAVWAVGDGGAVARYEVNAGRHVDRSAPNDLTSTWTGVAVAEDAGEETVYLANGSGVVLRGVLVDGDVTWGEGAKPGSGSSVADLAFPTPRRGVVCDTAGDVLETADGDAFERVGVDADGTLTAVVAGDALEGSEAATADGTGGEAADGRTALSATVADDDGSLHRRDGAGWTRERPTEASLFGLATGHGERLAVGADGTVLVDDGGGWRAESAPVDATLRGAALAGDGTALAVGDGGAAMERRRDAADGG